MLVVGDVAIHTIPNLRGNPSPKKMISGLINPPQYSVTLRAGGEYCEMDGSLILQVVFDAK